MSAFIVEFVLDGGSTPIKTVAVKDTIDVAGYVTTAGSRALSNSPAARVNARVVDQLVASGWRIKAKANMHELAFGMTGINAFTGTPINPQDATRIPGGSSSGSASAVGLALVDAALGTDTGGSIRAPAACCGVVGMKPTYGRVSRDGVLPKWSSLDCVGPFARDVATISSIMKALSDGSWVSDRKITTRDVGLVSVAADGLINESVRRAILVSGATPRPVSIDTLDDAFDAALTLINAETFASFGHLLNTGRLGSDVAARLQLAAQTTEDDASRAEEVRRRFTAEVDQALGDFEILVLPTLPCLPPTLQEVSTGASVIPLSRLVRPFNLSGHPALSLPIPVPGSPLKAGLQIVGRKGEDETVCAFAELVESSLRPPAYR